MSSSSTSSSALLLLSFSLLLQIAIGASPLFHICSTSETFTAASTYASNLNKLIGSLTFRAPFTGFGAASVGFKHDRANGIALCRGDANATTCKTCVAEAGGEIRQRCAQQKQAIIWYDNCLLKYSNTDFFRKIDEQNKFYMWNLRNVSHPASFNRKVKDLLVELAEKAHVERRMYAAGDSQLGGSKKLYGLVQCTRDLSSIDCKKCLDGAIDELPSCCNGKEGGRVVGGSCNIRYEIYPFVSSA
ncbi:cysteine-rich repeat secretory protein 38-like [Diospyros lotus]|uniref:cysteine-rich repeat secretory protein 38-like n=1 Tax=Diospyros lotus TaxID=55363 RepID=UPI0022513D31|nr:cysteine-rich repeat secretory protein 38-like [Diospyros lotus]